MRAYCFTDKNNVFENIQFEVDGCVVISFDQSLSSSS